jgi:hypothetical protein
MHAAILRSVLFKNRRQMLVDKTKSTSAAWATRRFGVAEKAKMIPAQMRTGSQNSA